MLFIFFTEKRYFCLEECTWLILLDVDSNLTEQTKNCRKDTEDIEAEPALSFKSMF